MLASIHHPSILATAGKKAGISALLVSFVLASTPAFAQTPPAPPPPAPAAPGAPAAPPEGSATPAAPPPTAAPPELPAPPPPPPAEVSPPPPPPPEAAPMGPPSPVPAYIMWGVGGASLVLGGVFGVMALSAKSDFDDHPTYSQADTVHDRTVAADVGLGLGLILTVSGTIFYFMRDQGGPPAQGQTSAKPVASVRVDPLVTPHTRGGALTLHF